MKPAAYHKLLAAKMLEEDLQTAVIGLAEVHGFLCYHTHDSRRSPAGFPDLALVHKRTGRLIFTELKKERGYLSPPQRLWLTTLQRSPAEVYLWKPRHLFSGEIEKTLRKAA
jgi:hypothetical protein